YPTQAGAQTTARGITGVRQSSGAVVSPRRAIGSAMTALRPGEQQMTRQPPSISSYSCCLYMRIFLPKARHNSSLNCEENKCYNEDQPSCKSMIKTFRSLGAVYMG